MIPKEQSFGRYLVRDIDNCADLGYWKKQMLLCNDVDTGQMIRHESVPTSSWF